MKHQNSHVFEISHFFLSFTQQHLKFTCFFYFIKTNSHASEVSYETWNKNSHVFEI